MGWTIDHWDFNSFAIDRNNTCRIGKKVFSSRRLFWAPFMMKITQREIVKAKGTSTTVIKKQWLQQESDWALMDATHAESTAHNFNIVLPGYPTDTKQTPASSSLMQYLSRSCIFQRRYLLMSCCLAELQHADAVYISRKMSSLWNRAECYLSLFN